MAIEQSAAGTLMAARKQMSEMPIIVRKFLEERLVVRQCNVVPFRAGRHSDSNCHECLCCIQRTCIYTKRNSNRLMNLYIHDPNRYNDGLCNINLNVLKNKKISCNWSSF